MAHFQNKTENLSKQIEQIFRFIDEENHFLKTNILLQIIQQISHNKPFLENFGFKFQSKSKLVISAFNH